MSAGTPSARRVLACGAVLMAAACRPPEPDELFNEVKLQVHEDEASAAEPFVAAILGAEDELRIALPAGDDLALSDAILRAHASGLDIEVLTDFDLAGTPAIAALLQADVPVALRDAGLGYFDFGQNADVLFTSDMTRMAHAYVVADGQRIVAASTIGAAGEGTRVVLEVRGEDIVQDLLAEHTQVYGGTDAVSVTAFDAPAKSIVDFRWRYGTTTDVDLEMWFGPQERVLKRVIDSVYSARSSVYVLTNEFVDEGLARALQTKAQWGFDVEVVVGPRFGQTNPLVSRVLELGSPAVEKRRLLEDPDATEPMVIPTLVLVDLSPDAEGYRPYARAFVLNHDIYSAARMYRGVPTITDQFIDSTMWVFTDVDTPGAQIRSLFQVYADHYERAVAFAEP
jgi:hypothetical protein